MKFTKEIKEAWLEALKSGKYTQAKGTLVRILETSDSLAGHCCIGVLGEITEGLDNDAPIKASRKVTNPYRFLNDNIGSMKTSDLFKTNDNTYDKCKPDYSNVIPLIESLPTN